MDLGSVAESLFESEMFGHTKGSFTNAYEDRTGKITLANKGTLLLDEIRDAARQLDRRRFAIGHDMGGDFQSGAFSDNAGSQSFQTGS